ncbi:MAG: PAS domain S-box protein, partial [Desulfobacterales bacterium]|nr:PAS domain S-box protein [Desulfobacterales bacterium]
MVKNLLSRNSFYVFWVAGPVLFAALYVLSRYNYLLFHSFIELFAVAIALSVFTVAWNTRHLAADNRLFLLAAAYLSIGVIDTVHTLAYSGMGVFPARGSDLPTQLWIAARYVESLSFLAAALLFRTKRDLNDKMILVGYVILTAGLLVMIIVLQYFPSMYVEGRGLTGAKVASEYVICAILAAAGYLFWSGRKQIGRMHLQFLLAAIGATIAGELSFTLYTDVYGFFNFLGHFFKLLSFWFIYKALVAGLLKDPFESQFLELVQSRDRLRESESSLNAVFEQTIQLMGIVALDGTLLRANRSALEMIGANEKDVTGKPFRDCPWWTHSSQLQEKLDQGIEQARQGEPARFEAIHISADGREHVVDFSINPIYDENGKLRCLLAESRDVTESKQKESRLSEAYSKLDRLISLNRDGIIVVDKEGIILFINPAGADMLGRSADELVGMEFG